jgi:4-hydroxybutyrate CoA-transferase
MPRVLGDSFIHISHIDMAVEVDYPLAEAIFPESTPAIDRIAEHIASMIPDGATLQLGIGAIPNAVLKMLDEK